MAGIFCCIWRDGNDSEIEFDCCKPMLKRRGPDKWHESEQLQLVEWKARFAISALQVYDNSLNYQEIHTDKEGNIFLWIGKIVSGCLECYQPDIVKIFKELNRTKDVPLTLTQFEGPFSIIYYHKNEHKLYFARDYMGRHRLLMNLSANHDRFTLSSSMSFSSKGPIEVPVIGIFVFDLKTSTLSVHPWQRCNAYVEKIVGDLGTGFGINIEILDSVFRESKDLSAAQREPETRDVAFYEEIIEAAVKSMNPETFEINEDEPEVLESEKKTSEIVETEKKTTEILESEKKTVDISGSKKKESNIMHPESIENIMTRLLKKSEIHERVQEVLKLLNKSIRDRLSGLADICGSCSRPRDHNFCRHLPLGILFSGGVDSTILAVLADKYHSKIQPIELFNVAFERDIPSANNSMWSVDCDVPDRLTGRQALLELKKLCPERNWKFVECNVLDIEVRKFRSTRLSELVDPLSTIPKDNAVACALWFASRGFGIPRPLYSNQQTSYPECRTILVGTGADELFGGYPRHRQTLNRDGWSALYDELGAELMNMSQKTVGMVSSVVWDNGKRPFFPYLDAELVDYVRSLKAWERCYPTDAMPEGLGDKLLLRLVAREIGLLETANVPHVPIEIGSGIGEL